MSTTLIGMKLGSNSTWIYKQDNGMVLEEPTIIAITTNLKNKEVKAVGYEAKKMIGRTPENVSLFSPISNGIVQYEELTSLLLKQFLKKIFPIRKFNQKIKAMLLIPDCLNYSEIKQYENCCYKAGINEVVLIPESLCIDLGNETEIGKEKCKFYVNIGYDQTNISIVSHNLIVNAYSLSIGCSIMSVAIKNYIEEKFSIKIALSQADYIKKEICSLFENYNASISITGLSSRTKSKEQILITSSELYHIVSYYYGKIAEMIKSVILTCDPEAISDFSQNGIYFYGGGSEIPGLEIFMYKATGFLPKIICDNEPEIVGTEKLITSPLLLKRITDTL